MNINFDERKNSVSCIKNSIIIRKLNGSLMDNGGLPLNHNDNGKYSVKQMAKCKCCYVLSATVFCVFNCLVAKEASFE